MNKLVVSFILVVIAGCATSYQPQGMKGGFNETQLDTNMFVVTFKGNGYTNQETVKNYALLRSAEVTLENGYKYFSIVDANHDLNTKTFTSPTTVSTNGNANSYGGTKTTVSTGGTFSSSKPSSTNTIVCFTEKPDGFTYNAEFLVKSITEKYEIRNTPNN